MSATKADNCGVIGHHIGRVNSYCMRQFGLIENLPQEFSSRITYIILVDFVNIFITILLYCGAGNRVFIYNNNLFCIPFNIRREEVITRKRVSIICMIKRKRRKNRAPRNGAEGVE